MEKIFKKLLNISHSINNEYGNLEYYSTTGMENTDYFEDAINSMEEYILMEEDICNKLDFDTIKKILDNIPTHVFNDNDLSRCYDVLMTKYYDLLYELNEKDESFTIEDKIDFRGEITEFDELLGIDEYLEEYDVNAYQYFDMVMCYIYSKAIKRIVSLLENTVATNKTENKFKKKLNNDFKSFKYDFFALNGLFEKIALMYRFDPKKIPHYKDPQSDLTHIDLNNVYYNECLVTIKKICELYNDEGLKNTTLSLLFYTLCFEEFIEHLNIEQLENIMNFIKNLDNKFKYSLPIDACYKRIKNKGIR